ncbi:sortase [Ruminococcus sp.]|uniref:sortase n=1 Tax=Ruminococcus sp. TaxID=41978 RepID=UPI0025E50389|nr:sortase [Ruminococcus sp.]MCR4639272.1 sortase [Ruminococcus sp.]
MRNKLHKLCIILGSALILTALCLCLYNISEDRNAEERSRASLSELRSLIGEKPAQSPEDTSKENDLFSEYEEPAEEEMPTVVIDNTGYCGYIRISELGLELPVINDFSYAALDTAPCRYSGSADTNDLIIAAHNFSSHFGRLDKLSIGSEIIFFGCDRYAQSYHIISIEEINGGAPEEMLSKNNTPWDLTLFTCTLSGKSRIAVRAKLAE